MERLRCTKVLELPFELHLADEYNASVYYQNIQSLRSNFAVFATDESLYRCHFIFLVETWLNSTDSSDSFSIQGFNMDRDDFEYNVSSSRQHTGIVCYIKSDIYAECDVHFLMYQNVQFCIVRRHLSVLICVPRRRSATTDSQLRTALQYCLDMYTCNEVATVMFGDFNENVLMQCSLPRFLLDGWSLRSLIAQPTTNDNTCLDHVYSNLLETNVCVYESIVSFPKPIFIFFHYP